MYYNYIHIIVMLYFLLNKLKLIINTNNKHNGIPNKSQTKMEDRSK